MNLRRNKGTILIITLWILAILALLSVGVAGRMGLELKLTGLYRDNMTALYLAKAGIERAIVEKEKDTEAEKDLPQKADTLNETWANKKDLFDKKNPFIVSQEDAILTSYYTIKYIYKETKDSEGIDLYGMMDEASKININKLLEPGRKDQLVTLLRVVCDLNESDAIAKVEALMDWIDADTEAQGPSGDENTKYYSDMGTGYCKNTALDCIEEILLVAGFDSTILYGDKNEGKVGIIDYITIYTADGAVNVNTAPKEVLQALGFKDDYERIASDIIAYRKNSDNPPVTKPQDIKAILTDLTAEEISKIDSVIPYLTTTSKTFRIYATGKVNKVEKRITCVVALEQDQNYKVKYWNEN